MLASQNKQILYFGFTPHHHRAIVCRHMQTFALVLSQQARDTGTMSVQCCASLPGPCVVGEESYLGGIPGAVARGTGNQFCMCTSVMHVTALPHKAKRWYLLTSQFKDTAIWLCRAEGADDVLWIRINAILKMNQ